jgi:hypothetical protein
VKLGYHLELFLRNFKINSTFLDKDLPESTNRHYLSQFVKGNFQVCITCNEFKSDSANYALEVVNKMPISATIIYFDCIDKELLERHCFNVNTKSIYHFITNENKVKVINS